MLEQGDIALAVDPDEDDEDAEDDEIKPTDSLLVVALTEDEYSHLEVQLLADDGTMFIHHDISLPEFPLCLAWMDCPPFQADGGQLAIGNYIAVGTFEVKRFYDFALHYLVHFFSYAVAYFLCFLFIYVLNALFIY